VDVVRGTLEVPDVIPVLDTELDTDVLGALEEA